MRRLIAAVALAAPALLAMPAAAGAVPAVSAVPPAAGAVPALNAVPAVARAGAGPGAPDVPADLRAEEVSFRGGGLTLHGTVLSPAAAGVPRPGIVLVHGAGGGTPRTALMTEAVAFARQGMSVLVYDKRSAGYSLFERSYSLLADDALGAVAALRARPGVDPGKVGLWGLSEGGWVAPLAASRAPRDVAFVVLVGANGHTPLRQQTWAVAAGLRRAGVSGSLVDRAEPAMYRMIADAGLFPEPYHDAEGVLAAVRAPVLGIWGVHDLLTPPAESPPLMAAALERGGNHRHTFRYFAGADHAAHLTPDGGVTRLPELAPGYPELVGSWVRDVTSGRTPATGTSGPAPVQAVRTVPVEPSAGWESAPVQFAALGVCLAGFGGYGLVAAVRRVRRAGPASGRVSRAAGLLAAAGPVVMLGFFGYMVHVQRASAKLADPGPLLAGRPLPWLALQILAVVAVAAGVRVAVAWGRNRALVRGAERARTALLLAAGAVFLAWAVYWGLLLP